MGYMLVNLADLLELVKAGEKPNEEWFKNATKNLIYWRVKSITHRAHQRNIKEGGGLPVNTDAFYLPSPFHYTNLSIKSADLISSPVYCTINDPICAIAHFKNN